MKQATLTVRLDPGVKEAFEATCGDLGLTMSTAMNVFVMKVVREHRIPFVVGDEVPNDESLAAFEEAREIEAHPERFKGFSSAEDVFRDILG